MRLLGSVRTWTQFEQIEKNAANRRFAKAKSDICVTNDRKFSALNLSEELQHSSKAVLLSSLTATWDPINPKPMTVSFEGNIASGKSTFLRKLSKL